MPSVDPGDPPLTSVGAFLRWTGRRQLTSIFSGVFWGGFWMVCIGLQPWALGHGLDRISRHQSVLGWAGVLAGLCVGASVCGVMRHRSAVTNYLAAHSRMQQLIARKAARLGRAGNGSLTGGDATLLADADGSRIGFVFDVSARFSGALASSVLVLALLFAQSTVVGFFVVVGLPLSLAAATPLISPLERRDRRSRELLAVTSGLAADTVLGLRVLKGVGGEAVMASRFVTASQELRIAATRTAAIQAVLDTLQVVLPGVFTVGVAWIAAREAVAGRLSPGGLLSCYAYTAFLVTPLRTITEYAGRVAAGRVSARRVIDALLLETSTRAGGLPLPDGLLTLVDGVSGLSPRPGGFTCVVARDPVEATAVGERLAGVRPGAEAAGTPLSACDPVSVRTRILLAEKQSQLLAGRLEDSLDVPTGPWSLPVGEALAVADAADAVDSLGGLDGMVDERGRNLSGGQRQRVALARALVAGPDVLILDEPTSAVDAYSEARIAGRLAEARRGATTLVLTTSPPMLEAADLVVYLEGGRVRASGKHAELMASSRAYRACVTRELQLDGTTR